MSVVGCHCGPSWRPSRPSTDTAECPSSTRPTRSSAHAWVDTQWKAKKRLGAGDSNPRIMAERVAKLEALPRVRVGRAQEGAVNYCSSATGHWMKVVSCC